MLDVTIRLEELRCMQQFDLGGASEPYLWVLFFEADLATANDRNPDLVMTYNLQSGSSAREFIPGNFRSGTTAAIPEYLGTHHMFLDEDETVRPTCGVVMALLEENGTSENLIEQGHFEFGNALHDEINQFARDALGSRPMTPEERQAMTGRVEERVRAAIRRNAPASEYFRGKDRLIGFASETFGADVLYLLRDRTGGQPYPLAWDFHKEVEIPVGAGVLRGVDDYRITAGIQVSTYVPPPPDPCGALHAEYRRLERQVREFEERLRLLQSDLAAAPPRERPAIRQEIEEVRAELAPIARARNEARQAYQECRLENPIPR
jgi:hypothetical protein